MKRRPLLVILILCINLTVFAQTEEWKTLDENEYSIEYPNNWELNTSGEMGTSFFLFSASESENDNFRENINLLIQDLAAYNLDLESFTELSINQVESFIPESKINTNETLKKNGVEFQKVIYTGKQQELLLKFIQYYWVINKKAYILTFSSEEMAFTKYADVAERIMNSFSLKTN